MAARDDIIAFCDELLDASAFEDYGPNGLQVPGREEVSRVVSGVSSGLELFRRAAEASADLVLVHHGLFWEGDPRALSPAMAQRLRALLEPGISLAAYHLPVDAHPEIGNNALIVKALGAAGGEPFAVHRGKPIGRIATFEGEGIAARELFERVEHATGRKPLVFDGGPDHVRTIGVVSGGAAGDVHDAVAAGLDAFLTGEPAEHAMNDARDAGIHFIAAGHYATETFGIRRLGDLVADRFGIEHEFVDIPNPV